MNTPITERQLQWCYKDIQPAVQALAKRLGESPTEVPKWKVLGTGGHATVYWLSDRTKVLKVTKDVTDAHASAIVQRKPDPSLIKVYDVFQLYGCKTLYFIVAEKLTPLSGKAEDLVSRLRDFPYDIGIPLDPIIEELEEFEHARKHPANKLEEKIPAYLKLHDITEKDIQQLWKWARALDRRDIVWNDFKKENIMMRGHDLVISDLGYNVAPSVQIPVVAVT